MKSLFYQLIKYLRRQLWALIVAYMLGMHNFYKGENKTPDDIVITIEYKQVQEDGTPED
ncbi:hypothetical protein [Chryseolinea sp. H1M3-3]|uniref:hypothetical protein n=1 Tax=Chryseolinea sp. H1M3-3 TaxID=3034144 RepID=UPI0023ED364F|nr:hypothetical protein [Chryseolinea sp. H1M3-3]